MYIRTGKQVGSWSAVGQPRAGPPRTSIVSVTVGENVPFQFFECTADSLSRIRTVTGNLAMTREQVLDSVRFQAGNAAGVATKVVSLFSAPSPILAESFRSAFGVTHDSSPSWARPGAWSHGRIVRQRFLGAQRLLRSGSLVYSCWGRPRRAGGPEINPEYLALAAPGQFWIALGRKYWEADKRRDVDTTTHAFLLAALRAYYGPLLSDAPQAPGLPKFSNIHCYIKFVADLLNANLPDWVEANCPAQV